MKADEIEVRADLAVRVIFLVRAMLEERVEKLGSSRVARTGGIRTSDHRLGKRSQDRRGARVIELEIFFPRAFPVPISGSFHTSHKQVFTSASPWRPQRW